MTAASAAGWVRAQGDLYRQLEAHAHYHWRYSILVATALASTLTAGQLLPGTRAAMVAALAAWFIALAVPSWTVRGRLLLLGRRLAILTAATTAGVLASGSLPWSAAGIGALCLAIPLPGMTITPVICFIMDLDIPRGMTPAQHVGAFAAGGALAVAILLLPWAAPPTRHDQTTGPTAPRSGRRVFLADAQSRYATQAAVAVTATYLALHALRWPHPGWVLVGILTTLRPSWNATHARLVERSIGMVAGSALTAVGLAVAGHATYPVTVAMISILGGLARPLRQYNYGLWPILGTPVLLLLINLNTQLTTLDAAWRLGNNLLGALITLVAITFLWPHPTQQRPTRD